MDLEIVFGSPVREGRLIRLVKAVASKVREKKKVLMKYMKGLNGIQENGLTEKILYYQNGKK